MNSIFPFFHSLSTCPRSGEERGKGRGGEGRGGEGRGGEGWGEGRGGGRAGGKFAPG